MRLVVQRVKHASCSIDGNITGLIKQGFMVLVGFGEDDTKEIVLKMANKLSKLRVFEDENGKMNKGLKDIDGAILSISQFTLYADCSKGNRPSFNLAMKGEDASKLYDYFNSVLRDLGFDVQTGVFGADMKIDLLNDGPVTIIMDSGGACMIEKYALDDIVQMKKDHPCKKSSYWKIIRVGTDIKIKCQGCGAVVMMERREFERKCKKMIYEASKSQENSDKSE